MNIKKSLIPFLTYIYNGKQRKYYTNIHSSNILSTSNWHGILMAKYGSTISAPNTAFKIFFRHIHLANYAGWRHMRKIAFLITACKAHLK